jgi:hypothetical protein
MVSELGLGVENGCLSNRVHFSVHNFPSEGKHVARSRAKSRRSAEGDQGALPSQRLRLRRLRSRLLLHADPVGQLNQLPQVVPFLFAHQPSVRTRKVDRYESFGRKRRTDNQLCFLMFGQWLRHGRSLQMGADSTTNFPSVPRQSIIETSEAGNRFDQGYASKPGFKFAESPLQIPLLLRLFAGSQEVGALGGRLSGARDVGSACVSRLGECVRLTPQTHAL